MSITLSGEQVIKKKKWKYQLTVLPLPPRATSKIMLFLVWENWSAVFLSASLELRVGIQTTTPVPEHTLALPSFVIRSQVLSVPVGPQKEDSCSVPPLPRVFAGLFPSTYFFYIQQVSLSALNSSHTSCSPGPNQHSYVARWLLCDSVVTICTRLLSVTSLWKAA